MGMVRIAVIVLGVALPYLARLPGMASRGPEWMDQYTDLGIGGTLFLGALCAATWGGILAFSFLVKHPSSVLIAASIGLAYPFCEHATLDLASDAQAGIYVIFIHVYAIPFVALGGVIGWAFDWWLTRKGAHSHPSQG